MQCFYVILLTNEKETVKQLKTLPIRRGGGGGGPGGAGGGFGGIAWGGGGGGGGHGTIPAVGLIPALASSDRQPALAKFSTWVLCCFSTSSYDKCTTLTFCIHKSNRM